MLTILGHIINRLGLFFLIFRLNNKFLVPNNFEIKVLPKICYRSKISFNKNSKIILNGVLIVEKSLLEITDSTVTFEDSKLVNSIFRFKNSRFLSQKKFSSINSTFKFQESVISFGQNTCSDNFSFDINESELVSDDFILCQTVFPKSGSINSFKGKVKLGRNNRLQAKILVQNGNFITKDNVFINHGSEIRSINHIEIGNNCFISYDVFIIDNNSHSIYSSDRIREIENGFPLSTFQSYNELPKSKPVIIKNNVWIGIRSIVMKGVSIEDNSIVSAGTVLTKNVPSNSIVYQSTIRFKNIE